MDLKKYMEDAVRDHAADIFIIAGKPISYTSNGRIVSVGEKLLPPDTEAMISELYEFSDRDIGILKKEHDDDFSFSLANVGRFRVNAFLQRGSLAAVLKVVLFKLPDPDSLMIPQQIIDLHDKTKGFILVTGPTGSGKSTTLACLIDKINRNREAHIITLEDPLEFLHKHEKSIVSQREIYMDTPSYERGLRAALREAPDVILLGEMRDFETISIAMSAAETGQLVFSTLHTLGAANTVDRIVDVFPADQQRQVRIQLSMVLQAVISQQLIPSTKGTLVPAFEIMICNNAIRTMIRESKSYQIDSTIYSSADTGMISMDSSLLNLYEQGLITAENALIHSLNPDAMKKKLGL
jgi:twitching motility protein PilT